MDDKKTGLSAIFFAVFLVACGSSPEDNTSDDTDTDSSTHIILPEGPVSNVFLELHPQVSTLLIVNWTQDEDADFSWIEFSFENDEWNASEKKEGATGEHREVVLGVPEETEMLIRIVNETSGTVWHSDSFEGKNGAAPDAMPRPSLVDFAPSLASGHKWLLGSVENTLNIDAYWGSPYYVYIIDRQARVVWYYYNPLESRILFPRPAPEGTHIIFDESEGFIFMGEPVTITRATLDFEHQQQVDVPEMSWGYDVTDDGNFLFDYFGIIKEMDPSGDVRTLWDCQAWLPTAGWAGAPSDCFSNTVSWSSARDSVVLSHPWDVHAAIEIDRESGELKSNWGNLPFSWEFVPSDIEFDFQHFPNITPDGTLLVSSHVPGSSDEQRIMEFDIDDDNQVLTQIWTYGEGISDYADQSGEATRISNGNTLINYGTGGVIREVTPEKETAWHVVFDADFSIESSNKLLGHTVLIDNLYDLNRGL